MPPVAKSCLAAKFGATASAVGPATITARNAAAEMRAVNGSRRREMKLRKHESDKQNALEGSMNFSR
jgi:hypothetical protein